MADNYYDIIITGAGVAGLSAAIAISKQSSLSLALIESKKIGANNPSPLTFSDVVEKFNLFDCIKGSYASFFFHNYQGSLAKYHFSDYPLVALDYQKACMKLFSVAENNNGFDLIKNKVIDIVQSTNRVIIKLKDGNSIQAKILIDCSGKSQLTAKKLFANHVSHYSHVYGAVFSGVKNIDDNSCCFLWPHKEFGSGGGWYYSLSNGKVSFGYATISNNQIIDKNIIKSSFHAACNKFAPYSSYLKNAKLEYIESGTIPISYINKFINNNIIIAGDAAGMATSWTCMGIEPALKYGTKAGHIAVKAVLKNDLSILNDFQNAWEKENKATFDLMATFASTFWSADHDFWEQVLKIDLSYLSPQQVIDRMRRNEHLMKKSQIISRSLKYKIKSIFNKKFLNPQTFIIRS